jgi:FKBP-type peptidyl-prolyl cis-trans isomerase FkpA
LALAGVAAVTLATAGCADETPTAPSHYAPFSQTDIVVGTGAEAVNGSVLSVDYTGWLYNELEVDQKGAVFDSTLPFAPFQFRLGSGGVIAGWDRGIAGMKVGGTRRLVVPPSLAYGAERQGAIPPNATLLFEVELIDVQ